MEKIIELPEDEETIFQMLRWEFTTEGLLNRFKEWDLDEGWDLEKIKKILNNLEKKGLIKYDDNNFIDCTKKGEEERGKERPYRVIASFEWPPDLEPDGNYVIKKKK